VASMSKRAILLLAFVLIGVGAWSWWPSPPRAMTERGHGPVLESIGPLAFGADGVLFAADTGDASIYALEIASLANGSTPGVQNTQAVDQKIAAALGARAADLTITDLAVEPSSRNVFLSVQRGRTPALVRIDGAGRIAAVPFESLEFSKAALPDAPTGLFSRGDRAEVVTDMALVNDRLWVAGLSNEEFSSKLRAIPYPFTRVDRGTSVEIFHGSHGEWETASPIYTFAPYTIGNEPRLVAGYLCTPLVTFSMAELAPGAKVRGKTIAELGNMNRPLDMVIYRKDGRDFVLMSNNSRGVMKIPTESFATANAISARVAGEKGGAGYETIAGMRNVEQLDLLDAGHAAVLVRAASDPIDLRVVALP
jgi:hypothetical protein